jgi:hypothetical protein
MKLRIREAFSRVTVLPARSLVTSLPSLTALRPNVLAAIAVVPMKASIS